MENNISSQFLLAALKIGNDYLTSGGSITKLEDCLTQAGHKHGLMTAVHATPTGISISCIETTNGLQNNLSTRLGTLTPHLGNLVFLERLLISYSKGTIQPQKLIAILNRTSPSKSYPRTLIFAVVFLLGFTTSYNRTLQWHFGLIGGIVTLSENFRIVVGSISLRVDVLHL